MLISFIPFQVLGVTANIMSLAGIAIAIGALVDAAIVVVEQTHKKLEQWERDGRPGDYQDVMIEAVKEVGGPSFFALLVIAVSFLPVLTLEAQEGRLFKPLAYTKNLAMIVAAFLAITLDPALRMHVHAAAAVPVPAGLAVPDGQRSAGRAHPFGRTPSGQPFPDPRSIKPVCEWSLRRKWLVIGTAAALLIGDGPRVHAARLRVHAAARRGVGPLHAVDDAGHLDHRGAETAAGHRPPIKQFPEVDRVLGKAGRAETATDPAPLSMLETVIIAEAAIGVAA